VVQPELDDASGGNVRHERAKLFDWAAVATTAVGVVALVRSFVIGFEVASDPFAYANRACTRPHRSIPIQTVGRSITSAIRHSPIQRAWS
jgi:hypothetical protein